eukprot:s466_g17.t1
MRCCTVLLGAGCVRRCCVFLTIFHIPNLRPGSAAPSCPAGAAGRMSIPSLMKYLIVTWTVGTAIAAKTRLRPRSETLAGFERSLPSFYHTSKELKDELQQVAGNCPEMMLRTETASYAGRSVELDVVSIKGNGQPKNKVFLLFGVVIGFVCTVRGCHSVGPAWAMTRLRMSAATVTGHGVQASTHPSSAGCACLLQCETRRRALEQPGEQKCPQCLETNQICEMIAVMQNAQFVSLFNCEHWEEKKPLWKLIVAQFEDLLVRILLLSAVVSFFLAYIDGTSEEGITAYVEPLVILLILIANAIVGVWQETNAEKALVALKRLQPDSALVLREGRWQQLNAEDLVPGDLVQVKVGDKVPADMRLVELHSSMIRVEQSQLTGESQSVSKELAPQEEQSVIQAKVNMLFSSTTISNGSCVGVVTSTGMETEIGAIQEQLETVRISFTCPKFAKFSEVIFAICALVWAINYKHFFDPVHGSATRQIAVALAVAAIPEGLPAEMCCTKLVLPTSGSNLEAYTVEGHTYAPLGIVSGLCINEWHRQLQFLAKILVNCNDARTPAALLVLAEKLGCPDQELQRRFWQTPRTSTDAMAFCQYWSSRIQKLATLEFTRDRKSMSVLCTDPEVAGPVLYVKGAPESILLPSGVEMLSEAGRQAIQTHLRDLGSEALRPLALAMKDGLDQSSEDLQDLDDARGVTSDILHRLVFRRCVARSTYEEQHHRSIQNPEGFWSDAAADISWIRKWHTVLDKSKPPFYRWFAGGQLNMCYNAVDRHVEAGLGAQTALIYDSPLTNVKKTFTFEHLRDEVAKVAGCLASKGVGRADRAPPLHSETRVVIYMPMIPEAVFAMLACARLGAVHSVVFGGFAGPELATRIRDAQPKADWDVEIPKAKMAGCVAVEATDPLYVLYTSGSTGTPKGVVRDTGGYAVALKSSMTNFMKTFQGETYWAASDIGWVVGHSYIVYGPLIQGCATVLYEGKPVGTPDAGAFWRVIQDKLLMTDYSVRSLFAAPTALRAIRRVDPEGDLIRKHDLSSLRSLFVAGERCDPETSEFFATTLQTGFYDNWWQTETGHPICGLQDEAIGRKDGSTSLPLYGYDVVVLDDHGVPVNVPNQAGSLLVKLPLPPGTFPTLWKNDAGFLKSYMEAFPGYFSTGDAGVIDEHGYVTVLERSDDIINDVNDCAVVGAADPVKGQVPLALLVLNDGLSKDCDTIVQEVKDKVRHDIGAIASLAGATVVEQLPKTRSGKVLRKNIRGMADGKNPPALDFALEGLKRMGFAQGL